MSGGQKGLDLVQGILGALLATALADGEIQPEERAVLGAVMDQFDLKEGELVKSYEAFKRSAAPIEGPTATTDRLTLMQYAILAAQADGKITRSEAGFLVTLGKKLGLTEVERKDLEQFSIDLHRVMRRGKIDRSKIQHVLSRYVG